jgi:hypothetical protein
MSSLEARHQKPHHAQETSSRCLSLSPVPAFHHIVEIDSTPFLPAVERYEGSSDDESLPNFVAHMAAFGNSTMQLQRMLLSSLTQPMNE